MKKILTTILIISALLTLSINCFATETTYTLDFSQYEQYKNELAEIVSLIEKRPQDFDYFTDMEIEKLDDFFTENTLVYPSFFCDAQITAATADDFASIIPGMSRGDNLPSPTLTKVPVIILTILYK